MLDCTGEAGTSRGGMQLYGITTSLENCRSIHPFDRRVTDIFAQAPSHARTYLIAETTLVASALEYTVGLQTAKNRRELRRELWFKRVEELIYDCFELFTEPFQEAFA